MGVMMKIHQRLIEILVIINKKGDAKIDELSKIFNVDQRIIRRDLDILEDLNYIERFRGGAKLKDLNNFNCLDRGFTSRRAKHRLEKLKIAEEATKYIKENDNIFILGGTTTFEMVNNLPRIFSFNVATNFYPIIEILSQYKNIGIFSTGGLLDKKSKLYYAHHAENFINYYNIDKLFLGCSGISKENVISTFDCKITSLMNTLIKNSNKVFLLVDSSKFGIKCNLSFAPIKVIDTIITDNRINTKYYNIVKNEVKNVIIVNIDT